MRNQSITIRRWWEEAPRGGRAEYGSLANLSAATGLSRGELERLFETEVSTLGEWWRAIGRLIYGHHEDFAKGLTLVARELSGRPDIVVARRTITYQIGGGRTPGQLRHLEYHLALFAITALPCYWHGDLRPFFVRAEEVARRKRVSLEAIESSGAAFLQALDRLNPRSMDDQERRGVEKVLRLIAERLSSWLEDQEIVRRLDELF